MTHRRLPHDLEFLVATLEIEAARNPSIALPILARRLLRARGLAEDALLAWLLVDRVIGRRKVVRA